LRSTMKTVKPLLSPGWPRKTRILFTTPVSVKKL